MRSEKSLGEDETAKFRRDWVRKRCQGRPPVARRKDFLFIFLFILIETNIKEGHYNIPKCIQTGQKEVAQECFR